MRLSGRIFIEGKDLYLNPANGVLLRNESMAIFRARHNMNRPILDFPIPGNPTSENPMQLNKDINKFSLPILPSPYIGKTIQPPEWKRKEQAYKNIGNL